MGKSEYVASKGWPFRQERVARSAGRTGTTGTISCETVSGFLGKGMVLKSQVRPTLLTTCPWQAEQFTLNLRQSYDSMLASVLGKAQSAI
jgi:hypothetical protein